MFQLDTEEKAYLFGWIASIGLISYNDLTIKLELQSNDINCFNNIRNIIYENISDISVIICENILDISSKNMISFVIYTNEIFDNITCQYIFKFQSLKKMLH